MLFAAAMLSLAQASQSPEIFAEVPDGWSFERIEFPLDFAPDIELEGFEELLFAPGMFDPDSGSYFSYALALRVKGDQRWDAEWLESFLVKYYRGLCEAVSADGEFELDLGQVAAEVVPGGPGYRARVFAFDAFVTGAPLILELELSIVRPGTTTELLGLASPVSADEAVWDELRAVRAAWRAAREPEVFLNHLYYVPDANTYAALAGNGLLRQAFAVSEERSTVRADVSYTGLYFYGENTYFEFLQPDPKAGFDQGESGLAFGIERAGGTDWMSAALDARDVVSFIGPITRGLSGEQVPWFRILGVQQAITAARLQLFSLEYDPAFLERWHGNLPPEGGGIARARILERYAARLGVHERRRGYLLQDVTEVHLGLTVEERDRLVESCVAFGLAVTADGERSLCQGPGYLLVVQPAAESRGILGFVATLRRPVASDRKELGGVTIVLEGRTATFSFAR